MGEVKIWNVKSSLNSKTAEENGDHKDPFLITRIYFQHKTECEGPQNVGFFDITVNKKQISDSENAGHRLSFSIGYVSVTDFIQQALKIFLKWWKFIKFQIKMCQNLSS